jgi:hypothetical protein
MSQLRNGRPIDDISDRVRTAEGRDWRELQSELVGFLSIAKRDREALQVLDQMSERNPNLMPWSAGAEAE